MRHLGSFSEAQADQAITEFSLQDRLSLVYPAHNSVPLMPLLFPTSSYHGTPYKPAQAGSIVNMQDLAGSSVHVSMAQA